MKTFIIILILVTKTTCIVVEDFKQCNIFFYNYTEPQNLPITDDYVKICQNINGISYYATLYDKSNKIPIYSAYLMNVMSENDPTESKNWYFEVGLPEQATNSDFKSPWTKIHLNPYSYHSGIARRATLTLTNTIPQDEIFLRVYWNELEKAAKLVMSMECLDGVPYFITGVIPGIKKMNKKIDIPIMMYTAACCAKESSELSFSFGYYGYGGDKMLTPKTRVLDVIRLGQAIQKISELKKPIRFFDDDCNARKTRRGITLMRIQMKERVIKRIEEEEKEIGHDIIETFASSGNL